MRTGNGSEATTGRGRDPRTVAGLDPRTATVHDAVATIPGAGPVFARHGIDTCCGGELPLAEAAEHHGVELGRLLDDLEAALAES